MRGRDGKIKEERGLAGESIDSRTYPRGACRSRVFMRMLEDFKSAIIGIVIHI